MTSGDGNGLAADLAVDTALGCLRRQLELPLQITQRGAQAFFNNRVIKRAVEHLLDGETGLHRPRQQMAQVLGGRADHFGAEKASAAVFAIDVQRT